MRKNRHMEHYWEDFSLKNISKQMNQPEQTLTLQAFKNIRT